MTIQITSPEVESMIRERLRAGSYRDAEELLREVLVSTEHDRRTGADLIAAMRSCPYPEEELVPSRVPSPLLRDVSL